MENLIVESDLIVYKEIVGPAIYDRYGEDMMMVESIDFVFGKDAFKTTKVNMRDFIGVIRSETSKSNREGNNWTTLCWKIGNHVTTHSSGRYQVKDV